MDPEILISSNSESTNEKLKSPSRSEASSPESNCAICLGKLENNSFTDSCFHTFCFVCLLEWSKVRAVCPLCQQPFRSIIHNVRSIEDYDQYHLRPSQLYCENANQRFRYRTTMVSHHHQRFSSTTDDPLMRRNLRSTTRERQLQRTATSEFRRSVYANNIWVRGWGESGQIRYRNISPEFYRTNSACTHRLIPWLNRELNVLLHNVESQVSLMLELIMAMITRYEITGQEFYEHVHPYLQSRTEHFVHEFVTFARSPYDMALYDQHAVYDDVFSNTDNDVIILTPAQEPEQRTTISPQPSTSQISESLSSSDTTEVILDHTNTSVLTQKSSFFNKVEPGQSGWNPPIEIHLDTDSALSSDNDDSVSFGSSVQDLSSVSKKSDDECLIVGYVKPIRERTPLVVDLISNSDDESQDYDYDYNQSPQFSRSKKLTTYCKHYTYMDGEKHYDFSSSDSSRGFHHTFHNYSKRSRKRSSSSQSKDKHKKSQKCIEEVKSSSHVHKHHKKKHKHKHKKKSRHHSPTVTCKKHHKGHKSSSNSSRNKSH